MGNNQGGPLQAQVNISRYLRFKKEVDTSLFIRNVESISGCH